MGDVIDVIEYMNFYYTSYKFIKVQMNMTCEEFKKALLLKIRVSLTSSCSVHVTTQRKIYICVLLLYIANNMKSYLLPLLVSCHATLLILTYKRNSDFKKKCFFELFTCHVHLNFYELIRSVIKIHVQRVQHQLQHINNINNNKAVLISSYG
jgi:hypothetical protein